MRHVFPKVVVSMLVAVLVIGVAGAAWANPPVAKWNATISYQTINDIIGVNNKLFLQEQNGFRCLNENGDLVWNTTYPGADSGMGLAGDENVIVGKFMQSFPTATEYVKFINATDGSDLFHLERNPAPSSFQVGNGEVVYYNNTYIVSRSYDGTVLWNSSSSGITGYADFAVASDGVYVVGSDGIKVDLYKLVDGHRVWNTTIFRKDGMPPSSVMIQQRLIAALPTGGVAVGVGLWNSMLGTVNTAYNQTVYAYNSSGSQLFEHLIQGQGQFEPATGGFKTTSSGDVVFGVRCDSPMKYQLYSVFDGGVRFNATLPTSFHTLFVSGNDIYLGMPTNTISRYTSLGSKLWDYSGGGNGRDLYVNDGGIIFDLFYTGLTYNVAALVPPRAYIDGDIAPFKNTDARLTSDDALVALQCAIGKLDPDLATLTDGDVAPLDNSTGILQPNPNGQLNVGDAVVLLKGSVGQYAWEGMALLIGQQYMGNIVTDTPDLDGAYGYQFDLLIGSSAYDPQPGLDNATGALPVGGILQGSYDQATRTMGFGLISSNVIPNLNQAYNLGNNSYMLLKFPIPENVVADSLNKIAIINDSDPMNGFVDHLGDKISTPVSRTFYLTNENI